MLFMKCLKFINAGDSVSLCECSIVTSRCITAVTVVLNSVLFEFGIILIIGIYKNQGKHP